MIDAYLTYIRDIRRYSPRTQAIYGDVLADFSRFCEGEVVASLTPSMLRRYEADCMGRGLKPRTVHQHMSVLSGFCRFLMQKGVLKSNPARSVKRPKMEKRLPEFYQEKSMDAYFAATNHWAGEDELEILRAMDRPLRTRPQWSFTAPGCGGSSSACSSERASVGRNSSASGRTRSTPPGKYSGSWEKATKCEKFR